MRALIAILFSLTSFLNLQAQELTGYVVHQGIYSVEDSSFSENNISGHSITVDLYSSKVDGTHVLRIGHKTKIGTTTHDYTVIGTEGAKTEEDYNIFVADNQFGGDIALKYNDEEFILLYGYNEKIEQWEGFYGGILINNINISFLDSQQEKE